MTWLNIRNVSAADKTADIYINGQIGKSLWDEDSIAASDFIATVNALGELDTINLMINSPGGSVSDGIAIHNFLRRHPATVNVEVLAEASSIASVIAMAGDIINMPANALMMIHDPMAPLMGLFNSDELRAYASRLDIVKQSVIPAYAQRTGKSAEEIHDLMKAETYMTGAQAVEMGFADNLLGELEAVACTDKEQINAMMTAMANKSFEKIKANMPAPEPSPVNLHEIALTMCSDAGFSALAVDMVKRCTSETEIKAQVQLATEIQNICVAAEMSEHAPLILAKLASPAEMLQQAITLCQANNEDDEVTLPDGEKTSGHAVINHREIYANRNNRGKHSC